MIDFCTNPSHTSRYAALGTLAGAETLSEEEICALATRQRWTIPQAQRWLARYRAKGMAGLAPHSRLARSRTLPDLGTLSEAQQDELFRRHALLGELAKQEHVSNTLLQKQAEAVGVSLRTLRDYHTRFRREGLAGLAPRGRRDKGTSHLLSADMAQFIEDLRLTHRDASVRFIYELACQHAAAIGIRPPGLLQVPSLFTQIPAPVRLLADGREEPFRNHYRLTSTTPHDPHRIFWQIDHKTP